MHGRRTRTDGLVSMTDNVVGITDLIRQARKHEPGALDRLLEAYRYYLKSIGQQLKDEDVPDIVQAWVTGATVEECIGIGGRPISDLK